ncbi:cobaltochelatase subunit CobN [Calothrix sp. UHCC 0171]|uniref:cobaltochelatase subunit CobN n=1 Tax=Calothrix sp. UHCC 0171 TaxID=3110245 RepID=UPI002B2065F6|nr:cobaltochelatase subunit CobN [Calothrix sp. UHCC 0171]MEA5570154.1 cobaltochelatase subunit CobN [Calothrix sp. UHCC 0171]
MHRISTTSVGWTSQSEGIIFVEQTPAPVVMLTAADTDIQTLAAAASKLPKTFPEFRVANLLQLQQQISIDTYAEQVLEHAQVIILRLLGGRSYWAYGWELVQEIVELNHIHLIVMPGDDALDPDLISHSTLPLAKVNQIWRYFNEGGIDNFVNALEYISDNCLSTAFNPPPPQAVPRVGIYEWNQGNRNLQTGGCEDAGKICLYASPCACLSPCPCSISKCAILFYRAHYLAGNTKVIDALCAALVRQNIKPVPIFVSSLRDRDVQSEIAALFQPQACQPISLLLNTTSFSLARLETETPQIELWQKLDVPVLQVILSGGSIEQWRSQFSGLSPRDIAMNVALPEVDGRIITRAVSFKALQQRHPALETDVVLYEPEPSRIDFVAQLAANWLRLRTKPPQARRIALILANYPTRDARLANGVGLDTPQSCVEILKALHSQGYSLDNLPENGDELIKVLTESITNDPEGRELRPIRQSLAWEEYQDYFTSLPEDVQQGILQRWEEDEGEGETKRNEEICSPNPPFPIPGIQLGNIFIGVQPSRGYELDPSLNYHAPDLEPTHNYLAFYYWVREKFGADAIVHVGKHGNLEWLPGKSTALSSNCYPEVALGAMPHLYPFIVNDPGEGSQAKRRAQAVILDHLTPPLTRAELYGSLHNLENLIDEYYEAESLNPSRLPIICDRISELISQENLHLDLGMEGFPPSKSRITSHTQLPINKLDGYLCELKEAQIRDGLHIFGQCPANRQLRDLIIAIARHPNRHQIGITHAISQDWGLDINPLTDDFSTKLAIAQVEILVTKTQHPCRTVGDAVEVMEEYAAQLVEKILEQHPVNIVTSPISQSLTWIQSRLLPSLLKTEEEITNLLRGLDGKYIPSAPSGAPTRGRPEVLPTGKNFYSVDLRAVPTESAWDVGRKAAETLIECYTQENGEYPKTLAISLWGTATMRTGGDDIAQALALLGVQPVWDGAARRVVDVEILPLSVLGRPRVDVTLRASGFFRDAFGNLIDLFDQAVTAVAALDEPQEQNPLAFQVHQETEFWQQTGLDIEEAKVRSRYRIFGSKPGAYGAGLQGLIESQNWSTDEDLARAYINWSSYAYTGNGIGRSAPEAFEQRLKSMQIVLQNQDNREHDLLDSDDYYQFQGGLTAAIRSVQGKNPQTYFGDNSIPAKPRIRKLQEEIARVYRSRVINPKWIAGVMRHGYKGAFEMAATVDYLFAYDATAQCVEDHMYEGIAKTYLFDSRVCEFLQQKNPYALRDIAERLLEAYQRNLWEDVNIQTLENLRNLVHQAEAAIE